MVNCPCILLPVGRRELAGSSATGSSAGSVLPLGRRRREVLRRILAARAGTPREPRPRFLQAESVGGVVLPRRVRAPRVLRARPAWDAVAFDARCDGGVGSRAVITAFVDTLPSLSQARVPCSKVSTVSRLPEALRGEFVPSRDAVDASLVRTGGARR